MGTLFNLDAPLAPLHFIRGMPGPVHQLKAAELRDASLWLHWQPPKGSTTVAGYRIERTRDGRGYERLGETEELSFKVPVPPLREPWFYRVTAFNARGAGRAKLVYYFERRRYPWRPNDLDPRRSRLLPIAVVPGLRVSICEWERA